MSIVGEAGLLRIYIGESDRWNGQSLAMAIVEMAHRHGLAGASVFHGFAGYGANSRIHTASILRLSEDLPVLIEIVDRMEKIDEILPLLQEMVSGGMITLQNCAVVKYAHRGDPDA
jgi:PII-like signaling protein